MRYFISFIVLCLSFSSLPAQEYERYKKLTDTSVLSRHLGYERAISVMVPLEWQPDIDREFPLIVIFDRQNERSVGYMLQTIDYMTSNEQMPGCVVITVGSVMQHRYHETLHRATAPVGKLEDNARFLFEELIPHAEQRYKAGEYRLLIGHSRYGYFTTAMLASHWDQLNGVVSISPFFRQDGVDLADSLRTAVLENPGRARYYRYAIGNDYPEEYAHMDQSLSELGPSSLDAHGWLFPEADHNVTPGLCIAQALYEIFAYWAGIQQAYMDMEGVQMLEIFNMEVQMNKHYGAPLRFALGILNGKGWDAYNRGEYTEAIDAWDNLLAQYPNFSEAYLYIMDAVIRLERDPEPTYRRFQESLQTSAFFTEEEKAELRKEADELWRSMPAGRNGNKE